MRRRGCEQTTEGDRFLGGILGKFFCWSIAGGDRLGFDGSKVLSVGKEC